MCLPAGVDQRVIAATLSRPADNRPGRGYQHVARLLAVFAQFGQPGQQRPHRACLGELEIALIHEYDFVAGPPVPGLDTEALCTEAMYLASAAPLPPGPPAGAGGPAISHCRDALWITATPGTMCHQMTMHACQAAGFTPHTRHQVDDFATTLALVAAGQGVALVPQLGLGGPPAGVLLTPVPLQRRTNIAYRSGAGGHPAVTAVAAALRSAVPDELGGARASDL